MRTLTTSICAIVLLSISVCSGQGLQVTAQEQNSIIDKTLELLKDNYLFPDRASAVARSFNERMKTGKYLVTRKLDEFLQDLNDDIQTMSHDKHLTINNNARIVTRIRSESQETEEIPTGYLEMLQKQNFRLREVKMLEGNIGYFKFDNFVELRLVREAFTGAMDFLHYSDAIILDLTDNGGGSSETADFLLSYFLPDSTIIGETWNRKTNEKNISVIRKLPGVRQVLRAPVFVLVSKRTSSAAEGVAYALQQLKRARIIGEQTKGLGNPGELFAIDDRLFVMIPTILNKNAVTGTNWDGTGVTPDIQIQSSKALDRARVAALRELARQSGDEKSRFRFNFFAEAYESMMSPKQTPQELEQLCPGEYEGGARILNINGSLYFVQGENSRKLTYMDDQTFLVEGRTDYRLRFPLDGSDVTNYEVHWFDNSVDRYKKVK